MAKVAAFWKGVPEPEGGMEEPVTVVPLTLDQRVHRINEAGRRIEALEAELLAARAALREEEKAFWLDLAEKGIDVIGKKGV